MLRALLATLQAVDEQRDMLASAKNKMEAQHMALMAVGAPCCVRNAARLR